MVSNHAWANSLERYAIVTGASRGIGKAIANELWNNGYSLILIARSIPELEKVKEEFKPTEQQHIYIFGVDITNDKAVDQVFKRINQQKVEIKVLINNAGYFAVGSAELSTRDLRQLIDTNLIGAHNMIRHVLPGMKNQKSGYIINIGSIAGNNAISGVGGYSASKYALRGLNDSLFKELSAYGIKVTCISPSVTETTMVEDLPGFKDGEKIQTLDIAKTVVFLLSLEKSAMIKDIEIYNTKMVSFAVQEQSLPIDHD
jgi:NADP-dependent 3-hydroxy acid dehydrogenase YdfG